MHNKRHSRSHSPYNAQVQPPCSLYESSTQDEDKPVLGTELALPLTYYLQDGDAANCSLRSIMCACFP